MKLSLRVNYLYHKIFLKCFFFIEFINQKNETENNFSENDIMQFINDVKNGCLSWKSQRVLNFVIKQKIRFNNLDLKVSDMKDMENINNHKICNINDNN